MHFISERFVKSSWISFVALDLALLLLLGGLSPASAAKRKSRSPEDLTNFLLSPRYSQWLVGPIAWMVSEKEIDVYLGLQKDEEAAAFISDFWRRRGGSSLIPGQGPRALFDARVEEADRLFGEGINKGHRTDRGTVFVLYGEPEEIRFEVAPMGRGEFLEIWEYSKSADKGLDNRKPERIYRFVNDDGRTILYRGPVRRQLPGGGVRR